MKCWPALRRLATLYRRTLARRPRVVAVVGSLGKSTTARNVAAALGIDPDRVSPQNEFSFTALSMLRVRPWDRHAVIEVGIAGRGQMVHYPPMLRPDIAVVTSMAGEHNHSLQSLEMTRAEKSRMVSFLDPSGLAVLNGDDPNVMWMRRTTRARVVTFGLDEGNDVFASHVSLEWPHGTRFRIHADGQTREVHTRLFGQTFVYATLAAVAVGLAEGYALDSMLPALEQVPPTPERLQPVLLSNGAYLLRDEFKSTLESIDVALDLLEQIPARRKFVVLGDVTDPPSSSGPIYRRLGRRIAAVADHAVFVGRQCTRYAAGAARAGLSRDAMTRAGHDHAKALQGIPADLGPGDVVLIKGRHSQRLGRIALALMGRNVRCRISRCDLHDYIRCDHCQMLDRVALPAADDEHEATDATELEASSVTH